MRPLLVPALRATASVLLGLVAVSCGDLLVSPRPRTIGPALGDAGLTPPAIVISQVYGGGGNAGATLKNDFIELFNPGATPVSVTGWSVQYASALGTSWAVTSLSGTIQPGAYYLIQEQAGAGGTQSLPTPDATGSGTGIAMAAGAGKVFLSNTTVALTTACPTSAAVVDKVSYGANPNPAAPAVSDCGFGVTGTTLTNTTSASRNSSGCAYTQVLSADFTAGPPAPRNSASPTHSCGGAGPAQPATVTVTPAAPSIAAGAQQSFSAAALDASSNPVTTTFTWSSSDQTIATVDANGLATGVAPGTVTITATAPNAVFGTASLTVTAAAPPPPNHSGDVVISQIYGGGGNSGATYKNDFIEIFNRSTQAIDLTGWSVQRTAASGAGWTVTPLTGSIPSGAYYLVQEGPGAGGTVDLPAPDASGTLTLGATNGKVLLAQTTTAFAAACPTGTVVVDIASYGAATDCGNSAPAPSNTTADIRKHSGCTYTPNPSIDYAVGAPTPRNSASPTRSCVPGPLDHVAITGNLSVSAGSTTQLSAEALDANENTVPGATFVWSSSDATVATVDATGLVSGVSASGSPATITAVATAAGVMKSASVDVQVTNPGGINWIDLSSSSTSLPPGFQTQLFATARDAQGGTVIPATFTFEAVSPEFLTAQTVQNTGIVMAVAVPPDASKPGIKITATPVGGGTPFVFTSHPITVETPVSAPTTIYAKNDEFGDPTPASSANPNDFLIVRPEYTISYNQSRGTPNWVSYELDARQMVAGQDRCNCFTADFLLPPDKQIFTSDYTNGGFDRGHMTRSADRTAGNVDNAITFYLTNVVPQVGDLNQGVWAQFENMLADSARNGRAVYIITGPLYSRSHGLTFVKSEGKIAIPDSTWKVALIGPGNIGNPFTQANVQNWDDLAGLTVLAVNMPNIAGVRNDPPSKYFTTVDAIEAATGYDILSLLHTGFQQALEYHDHAPVAAFSVTGVQNEGSTLTFDATASTDADLGRGDLDRTEALTYSWHFSDGSDLTGKVVTKTFANHGAFTATLTVTDAFGWPNTKNANVAIANLPPSATFTAPPGVNEGSAFMLSLTGGTDPSPLDAAALKYSFDCGFGAGYSTPGTTPSATCTPPDQGEFTVRGKVIDPGGAATEYTAIVNVANVAPTATFNAPGDVSSGFPIGLSLTSVLDPSTADVAAGFSYAFDCGTGTGYGAPSGSSSASCPTSQAGSRTVRGKVIDKDGGTTEYSSTVTVTRRLTALGPAPFWIGLKNSDDVGLQVDVRTEVLVNGAVVGSGVVNDVGTGSSGFNNAQLGSIALALSNGPVAVPPGAQVGVRTSVRRTCSAGNGHNSGRVVLWYNGQPLDDGAGHDAGTRFNATIDGISSPYFARLTSQLSTTAGSARSTVEVQVQSKDTCPNRPFSELGTWSTTLP